VHISAWPEVEEIAFTDSSLMRTTSSALILIRKSKSDAKLSMKAEIETAELAGPELLSLIKDDLMAVGKIRELQLSVAQELKLSNLKFVPEQ
jgi:valyl-tRNA synthetase